MVSFQKISLITAVAQYTQKRNNLADDKLHLIENNFGAFVELSCQYGVLRTDAAVNSIFEGVRDRR